MSSLIQKFAQGLELAEDVKESLLVPRNNQELKVFALSLPTLKYPDSYLLAGRLFMYVSIKNCPINIEEYLTVLDGVLRPEIKQFMRDHKDDIDILLEETYYHNFDKYNILSASSCVNYLLKISHEENPVETPCQMFLRQAIQFYYEDGWEQVKNCYYELISQDYVHASPTMFNAGTRKNQMASCFLLSLGDNLESLLYTGAGDVGLISKLQGGIGLSMNAIRHSNISNTGKSSGVLPFGAIYDKTISCVNQGGKRNGAMTITLIDWHIDFMDFIQTRDNYTHNGIRFKQANICAYLSRLFMQRVKEDKDWTFFCPAKAKIGDKMLIGTHGHAFEEIYELVEEEAIRMKNIFEKLDEEIKAMENLVNSDQADRATVLAYHAKTVERIKMRKNLIDFKTMKARDIYTKLCDMNVKSSMPYIVYRDPVNEKNNMANIGTTEGLNLCLEITEPATPDSIASCNLGHLNLKAFVKKSSEKVTVDNLLNFYDFERMGRATEALTRNINKVIDYNYYPLDERDKDGKVVKRGKISTPNFQNRPIGIGVSGLAEVFALLDIAYDSPEAFKLNKMIFACMYYHAVLQSWKLALQHGEYENYRTGECKVFMDGRWHSLKGSPLSNGFFQFDLWQNETDYLKSMGRWNEKINKEADNIPINPSEWGMDKEHSWSSLRKKVVADGVRNAMLIALMPTASSAQLLRNAETTEAHQTLVYSRKLVHGNFTAFSEPFVADMQKAGLWNKESIDFIMMANGSIAKLDHFVADNPDFFPADFYRDGKIRAAKLEEIQHLKKIHRGMYEISQKDTMQMARQRGIYICQSQSLNIYLPEPDVKKVKAVHSYSHALNLKTGMYYLRANPASQTDRFTVDISIQQYHKKLKEKKNNIICTDEVCLMCQ